MRAKKDNTVINIALRRNSAAAASRLTNDIWVAS